MSAKSVKGEHGKKPASAMTNLIAGGGAGMMEALVCHPLDTIKVRMQLSRRGNTPGTKRRGFIGTGQDIVRKETAFGLYKGLGAVLAGIVPKMAIRFTAYEWYKQLLADSEGNISNTAVFFGMFRLLAQVINSNLFHSRIGGGCHRGRRRGLSHGGGQDSNAGTIPLPFRST